MCMPMWRIHDVHQSVAVWFLMRGKSTAICQDPRLYQSGRSGPARKHSRNRSQEPEQRPAELDLEQRSAPQLWNNCGTTVEQLWNNCGNDCPYRCQVRHDRLNLTKCGAACRFLLPPCITCHCIPLHCITLHPCMCLLVESRTSVLHVCFCWVAITLK